MSFRKLRFLPLLAVLALLALVARAQTPSALRHAGLAPTVLATAPGPGHRTAPIAQGATKNRIALISCADGVAHSVTGTAQYFIQPDPQVSLYQPFDSGEPIVSGSFSVQMQGTVPSTRTAVELRFYDPASTDPIALSYPLERTIAITTHPDEPWLEGDFSHTVVTRMLSDNAAQFCTRTAVGVTFDASSSGALVGMCVVCPTATAGYARNSQGPIEFSGLPPVFGMSVCRAPIADDLLGVVQQVIRVNAVQTITVTTTTELLQSFVCPATATAEWVELAMPTRAATTPLAVSIYDFGNATSPPTAAEATTATATFLLPDTQIEGPVWARTQPFTTKPLLLAGHRYWLVTRVQGSSWSLGTDAQGGDPDGALYRRGVSGTAQALAADLSYRIIGTAQPTIDAPSSTCLAGFTSITPCTCTALDYPVSTRGRLVQPFPASGSLGSVEIAARYGTTRTVPPPPVDPRTMELRFLDASCEAPLDNTYPVAIFAVTPTKTVRWPTPPPGGGNTMTAITAAADGDGGTSCPSGFAFVADVNGSSDPIDVDYYQRYASLTASAPGYIDTQGGRVPLPGGDGTSSPIVALQACVATDAHSQLRRAVAQCLPVENIFTLPQGALVAQSLSVTYTVRLERLELAIPGGTAPFADMPVSLVETPDDNPPLPAAQQIASVTVRFNSQLEHAAGLWVASDPVTVTADLLAGHHYWLVLHPDGVIPLASTGGGTLGGSPGYANGRMVVDYGQGTGYSETGADLSFRVIGYPAGTTGVPTPISTPAIAWSLRASPNPFARTVALAWEGGAGAVEIQIVDVRGRMVRSVRPQVNGLAGTWIWRGETTAGQRAAPGVYFVRASRGGQVAVRRVTFVP